MADVSAIQRRARDRGQMLLIVAFGVAVMLVALALILNTSIYTENLATRGSDISGGKDATRYQAATSETVGDAITVVNYRNNSSYAELEENVRWSVWNYSNMSGRQQALDNTVTNVSLARQSNGTRVYQRSGENFSNKAGDRNWTVVENTDGVRNFSISASSLTEESPVDVLPTDPIFFVNFTDPDDDEWHRVYLFNNSDVSQEVAVKIESRDGSTETCSRDAGANGKLDVNVTAATMEGEDCRPLRELRSLYTDDFDVKFNNSNDIAGEYEMVVNSSYGDTNVNGDDATRPHKTYAIYSATVHFVYETKRLTVETDIRVAPGEFDD